MFQSTHPHGVRRGIGVIAGYGIGFNPRTHTGCDPILFRTGFGRFVSIHAPTRGATCGASSIVALLTVSIHAPTRGATPASERRQIGFVGFNPRTHTGCDAFIGEELGEGFAVSIHAPTRGATRLLVNIAPT